MSSKLIVVSSREPYVHSFDRKGRIICKPAAGGVHTSLDTVLKQRGGTWIAWGSGNADRASSDESGLVLVPPEDPRYRLRRLWLGRQTIENYYNGFSNQVLWPLCHSVPSRIRYRRRFWEGYRKANRQFAALVVEEAKGSRSPLVWCHDYQLATLPLFLRAALPHARIAHFWHIPWPGWDIFRTVPQKKQILEGLLACDWIGFHLEHYAQNFLRCARKELGAKLGPNRQWVQHNNHKTRVRSFPLGIDLEKFRQQADLANFAKKLVSLKKKWKIRTEDYGIGVDRLDYSKGIIEKLDAIRIFFRRFSEYRKRFTFLQIASPSRERIPAYQEHQTRVKKEVHRINQLYGDRDWKPVVLVYQNVPQEILSLLYKGARAALVTSLRDGMNLVAKEFIACQTDHRGALILSRFAGASKEMKESLLVNPFDVESIATALRRALRMNGEERKRRLLPMQRRLESNDIHAWGQYVLQDVSRARRKIRRS